MIMYDYCVVAIIQMSITVILNINKCLTVTRPLRQQKDPSTLHNPLILHHNHRRRLVLRTMSKWIHRQVVFLDSSISLKDLLKLFKVHVILNICTGICTCN